MKLVLKHARQDPPPVSQSVESVPPQIDETLSGMLAKDPDKRFQSAQQVAFALAQYTPKEEKRVVVVEVSSQYLDWVRSRQAGHERGVSKDAEGITPELANFLLRMSRRKVRRRKPKT